MSSVAFASGGFVSNRIGIRPVSTRQVSQEPAVAKTGSPTPMRAQSAWMVDGFDDILSMVKTAVREEMTRSNPSAPRVEQVMFSLDDTAASLGIGRTTLDRLVSAGLVQTTIIGATPMVSKAELQRVMVEGAPLKDMASPRKGVRAPKPRTSITTEKAKVLQALKKS